MDSSCLYVDQARRCWRHQPHSTSPPRTNAKATQAYVCIIATPFPDYRSSLERLFLGHFKKESVTSKLPLATCGAPRCTPKAHSDGRPPTLEMTLLASREGQWLSNACPLAPKYRTNRKGDISFETSPSQSDFSKFWFGPDHNVYSPGITRAPRACAHVSLILPLSQASQELPHFHLSGCPELSLVADPRRWWLVCSLPLEDCSSVEINATPRLREC